MNQKMLTIKYVRSIDGKEFGSITAYKLSEFGPPMVQVYKKTLKLF
jgi:hypothetical protein